MTESSRETIRRALQTPAGHKVKRVWPDLLNLTIGGWLILSAFVPAFSGPVPSRLATGLTGVVVSAVSLVAAVRVERWKEAINIVLGLWLIAAPFLFGIVHDLNPLLNFTLDGAFLVLHAAFQLIYPPWRRKGIV